jgi:hypothetical protein
MKKSKVWILLCSLALILSVLSGCSQAQSGSGTKSAEMGNATGSTVNVAEIADASAAAVAVQGAVMEGTDANIQTVMADFSDRDLTGEYYSNVAEVDLDELKGNYEIVAEGTYVFSGRLNGYQIRVSLNDTEKAQIVLSGADITSSDGPAIYVVSGDKVFITLAVGTENSLTDTTQYTLDDGDEPNACLFSKSDLTINGMGTLTVTGNYNHGIYSKDDLSLVGGTLNVTAVNDAIKGKDFVQVASGTYHLTAGSDGLVSNHADDPSLGYIVIQDGDFNINAANDGIQAETLLQIEKGSFNIVSGGGSANASFTTDGGFNENWGSWGGGERPQNGRGGGRGGFGGEPPEGFQPDGTMPDGTMPDGTMPGSTLQNSAVPEMVTSLSRTTGATVAAVTAGALVATGSPETSATADTAAVSDSAKGLKAGTSLLIMGGTFTLDTSDDCLHTNGDLGITGGTFIMASGDDGIHGDDAVVILAGTFQLNQSYEGIEGNSINIAGGDFELTAADDGFNAAGGNDGSAQGGRPGWGIFDTSTSSYLRFTSGTIWLDASGDGLDSNGYLYVEGGTIIVSGPTNSGNGGMDYGIEAVISGGTVVVAGARGMAQNFSDSSTQCAFLVNFDQTIPGGETLTVTDSAGQEIVTCVLEKDYQCAVISASGLKQGETYTVTAGSQKQDVTLDSIITGGGGGMGGFFGGW